VRETKGTGKVWASNVRHDWFGATVPAYCMVSGKKQQAKEKKLAKGAWFLYSVKATVSIQ